MSPLVIIGGRQALGLVFTCLSLALQVVAILLLVPRMGIIGVGWGYHDHDEMIAMGAHDVAQSPPDIAALASKWTEGRYGRARPA